MSEELLTTALTLAHRGYSVIPCVGKRAAVPWQEFQRRRAVGCEIVDWHRAGLLQNLAIVLGQVSGVFAIDLDGDEAIAAWHDYFGEARTVTVASGSGHGGHVYFRPVGGMPPTTRVLGHPTAGNIELRADGCYVIAPPSIHPATGRRYEFISGGSGVARLDDVATGGIVDWIRRLQEDKARAARADRPAARPLMSKSNWARAALERECVAVERAPAGAGNDTLNRAAYKLGQLVAAGLLAEHDVINALVAAARALSERDGEAATRKTIASGLAAGRNHPRTA